jgi:hypothetical protein
MTLLFPPTPLLSPLFIYLDVLLTHTIYVSHCQEYNIKYQKKKEKEQIMNDICVVLDLDGTLVSKSTNDQGLPVARPHLERFLSYLFQNMSHVGIWTSASREWYDCVYQGVLKSIMTKIGHQFRFVWCGDRCIKRGGSSGSSYFSIESDRRILKPLKKLWDSKRRRSEWGISRHNVLIVDDTFSTFQMNWGNAIPISAFDTSSTALICKEDRDSKQKLEDNDDALLQTMDQINTIQQNYMKQTDYLLVTFPSSVIDLIHSYYPIRSVRYIYIYI